jgi:uncharacterized protein Yka (UPF0111/DUF47 family)
MNFANAAIQHPRPLDILFKDHLSNTLECGQVLSGLFLNLDQPEAYITKVKQHEEKGDELTAEAYSALELLTHSEFIHLTEQFIKRLDDIVDGMNNTARLIDICIPRKIEGAAQEILSTLVSMIERLQVEIAQYPENELANVTACRVTLKKGEENADLIYHEWRKTQRRINMLPLVDEANWTEIIGILEQTTDAAYHAALLIERMAKYRLRQL